MSSMFDGSPDAVSTLGDKLYHKVKIHCRLLDLGYYTNNPSAMKTEQEFKIN